MRINKSLITLASGGTASSVPWSGVTGTPTTLSGYGITDAVPSSRTLTINGTSYDLSANRTWTIPTLYSSNGTLASARTVTLGGNDLIFSGSTTTTSVHSSGFLLVAGATYSATWALNVNGGGYFSGAVTVNGNLRANALFTLSVFGATFTETTSLTSPPAGSGFLYAKTDKKIYYKNSDGTDYDLTSSANSVPTTRILTINDTAFDLSADRSWSVGDYGTW